jgi:membrane-associated phospholipid phosphatase
VITRTAEGWDDYVVFMGRTFDGRWLGRAGRGGLGARGISRLSQPDAGAIETVLAVCMPRLGVRERLLLGGAPALAGLVGNILKRVITRRRPGLGLFSSKGEQSFPSSHVAHAASLAFAAAEVARRKGQRGWVQAAAASIAGAVGLSRLRMRAHWPTDILAGLVIGFASARLVSRLTAPRTA